MKGELISITTVSLSNVEFKNPVLAKATKRIMAIYTDAAKYAETKNREIAKILGDVAKQKAYLEDGFLSVAEYANETFGIQKNNAYKLANAGKVYNSAEAPAALKEMSPSKLAEIASLPRETVAKGIESGEISQNKTQKELREFASSKKEEKKAKTESKVKKFVARACSNDPALETGLLLEGGARSLEEWDERFLEYVKGDGEAFSQTLPTFKVPKRQGSDEYITIRRKVYYSRSNSVVIEFSEWDPKKLGSTLTPSEIIKLTEEKKDGEVM